MISPPTPPGTKVVCIYADGKGILHGSPSPLALDAVYTVAEIRLDERNLDYGPYVFLHEFGDAWGFAPHRFRRLDLPECLTTLLQAQPHDLEAVN